MPVQVTYSTVGPHNLHDRNLNSGRVINLCGAAISEHGDTHTGVNPGGLWGSRPTDFWMGVVGAGSRGAS